MSLDISVTNPATDETIDINWLRNPFGLCTWAENNFSYFMEQEPSEEKTLWYVINHWNYDKASDVDRPLFLEVVQKYGKVVDNMDFGYFWFTEGSYNQFIAPDKDVLPSPFRMEFAIITGASTVRYHFHKQEHIGIPMNYLGHPCFHLSDKYRPDAHTLTHYQAWYQQLIDFAEMLQIPGTTFYCSN